MDGHAYVERLKDMKFCISSYGKPWDICDKCRGELDKWFKSRKEQIDERNKNNM